MARTWLGSKSWTAHHLSLSFYSWPFTFIPDVFSLLLLILKQTNQALQKDIQPGEGGGPTDIKLLPSCFQAPGFRANTRPQGSHRAVHTAPRLTFSREGPPAQSPPGVGAQGTLSLGPLCTLRNSSPGSWTAQLQVGLQLLPVTIDTTALPRCCQVGIADTSLGPNPGMLFFVLYGVTFLS